MFYQQKKNYKCQGELKTSFPKAKLTGCQSEATVTATGLKLDVSDWTERHRADFFIIHFTALIDASYQVIKSAQ